MASKTKVIAYRLVTFRKLMGFSQALAAKLLGVSPSRLSQWEKGERMPSVQNLLKLSILYKRLPDELYFELRQSLVKEMGKKIKRFESKLPESDKPT